MTDSDTEVMNPVQQDVTAVSPGTKERRQISNPGSPPIPESVDQQRVTHDRMFRRYAPYRSSPKSSRLSTQFMKPGLQPERLNQESKEYLDSGLSQVNSAIMRDGFHTILAAREVARQRMLLAAWETEEARRLSVFLCHTQAEHEEHPSGADELLREIRNYFTPCYREGVEDSKEYLQSIQEGESETFQVITAQAKHVSNLLGRDVTQSFLRFTGDEGIRGEYILHDSDVDSETSDD